MPVIPLPGGFQPRSAVAYSLVVALEVAALCGAGERLHSEIDVAAAHAERLVAEWGPDAPEDCLAKELARGLHGTVAADRRRRPDRAGRLPLEDADQRERQAPASPASCPSSTTTRSCGWEGAGELGRFSAVFLDDSDLHPRIRQRIELTRG